MRGGGEAWPKRTSGRMRCSGLGSHQAHLPSRRSSTGTSSSRTRAASSSTATPRMTPISLGGSGPDSAKVKNTATITAAAAKIDAPGVRDAADHGLVGVVAAVPVLLGRGEQEHGVVHRDREDHREEEHRPPGVEEALGLEARAGRCRGPSWKISRATPNAAPVASRLVSTPSGGDQRRLQRDEQQQEPEGEDDADDQRRLGRQHLLEVVVLGDRAADQRSRRHRGAQAIDGSADGLGRRVGVGDRLHQGGAAGAGHRRHDPGDAGVGLGDRRHALRVALGGDDLERARARPGRRPAGPGCSRRASCRRSARP